MFTENLKILLLCKKNNKTVETAIEYLHTTLGDNLIVYKGDTGDPIPEDLGWFNFDYLISFLSPWIIPAYILKKAKHGAINFHPAPPEYPGLHGLNFALYDGVDHFGVTCHYMKESVYTGQIIKTHGFKIHPMDTYKTAQEKIKSYLLVLFYDIVDTIFSQQKIETTDIPWSDNNKSNKDFFRLCKIDTNMSHIEIAKRIRATNTSDGHLAHVSIGEYNFFPR